MTEYVNELILILEDEVRLGNLSPSHYKDYVEMINYSAERVFHKYQQHQEEVFGVTKSKLRLPSDEIDELKDALAEKEVALAVKDEALTESNAIIEELQKRIKELEAIAQSKI